ncbi:MAG: prolyl-tRNA synthetase associated domain-containing protein [Defluviitaleaceae bacterium]|nr:prolyl-tRNA synthetase associated domain-containing protein [Defluviitaleaceae bacterium]
MSNVQETCDALDRHGVQYELVEHSPVMTVDEFRLEQAYSMGTILKNLFLRDDSGKRTFMFSCHGEKRVDLKKLSEILGVKRLGFASPDRLMRYTGLTPGAVSPLGLLFDIDHHVTMVFDKELHQLDNRIGVHPGVNSATVFLKFGELARFLEEIGANVIFIEM